MFDIISSNWSQPLCIYFIVAEDGELISQLVLDLFSAMRLQRFRGSNNLDQFSFIFEALIGGNLQGRTTSNNQQPLFCLLDCGRIWRSKSHS